MPATGSSNSQRGFALLSVVWGLAVLALLAVAIAAIARDRSHRAHNLAEAARAEAMADGGFVRGMRIVGERVSDPLWRADGRSYAVALPDGVVEVVIRDEAGRIDLNFADEALLTALLVGVGVEQQAAEALKDAILDWADADDLRRLNGAEAMEYRAAGLDRGPANRPFAMVAELALVKGMSSDLVRRLEPHLTVYGRQRGIDPTVASPALLALLPGVSPERVGELIRPDGVQPAALGQFIGLEPHHVVASRRQVFSVRAVARTAGGGTFVREAVIRLLRDPARPYAVLAWWKGGVGD